MSDFTVQDTIEQLDIIRELAEHSLSHIASGNFTTGIELIKRIASAVIATEQRISAKN